MSLIDEQFEFAKDLAKLVQYIADSGYAVSIGEVERPKWVQEKYVAEGKSKTMNSNHLRKCAADLFIFFKNDNGKYEWITDKIHLKRFGDFWCNLNALNQWGGFYKSFVDTPHFERRPQ